MMLVTLIGVSVFALIQSVRIGILRAQLPRKSVNTINGILLPACDDFRWALETSRSGLRLQDEWVQYTLGDVVVNRREPNASNFLRTYSVRFKGSDRFAEGFAVKRYWKAIDHAFIQRKALTAMESAS